MMSLTDSLPQDPFETLTGGIPFKNQAFLPNGEWDAAIPRHETETFYPPQSFLVNNAGLHHQASATVQNSHAVLNNANLIPSFQGDNLVDGGLQCPEGGQCDPSHKQDSLTDFVKKLPLLNECRRQLKKKVATPSVLRASLSRRKEPGPAKFKCSIEGCGSDFTRKSNLNSGSSMARIDCITHLALRPPKVP